MIHPTRVLQLARDKSHQLFSLDSEKFTCRLDKFLTVYHGYSRLKPRIFPKRMSAMFPPNVVVEPGEGEDHRHFHPGFGTTASLKRHRMDWSEKYERTRPAYAETSAAGTAPPEESDCSNRRLHIVSGAEVQDRRKTSGRGKKSHMKSSRRVVLRPVDGSESSGEIVCSSVLFTYREGLFNIEKRNRTQRDRNCTDV